MARRQRSAHLSRLSAKYLALAERAQRRLDRRRNPVHWIESSLTIRAKDRRLIPLVLNDVQRFYYQHRTSRDIILKARQQGITTIIEALLFADCVLRPNTTSVLIAHDLDSATKIFEIARLFAASLPGDARRLAGGPPVRESKRELVWPNGSRLWVGSAESKGGRFGHGLTIQNLHCSEIARWSRPEESLVALFEAVPASGRIVLESTPAGFNHFHRMWTGAAGAGFQKFFFTWWDHPEYCSPVPDDMPALSAEEQALVDRHGLSPGQIQWRRQKVSDLGVRFREQYPEDSVSCFLASTRAIFDLQALQDYAARIAAAPPPRALAVIPAVAQGRNPTPVAPATLLVWQPPVEGRSYAIGADVGEGLAGGDASCAVVLDIEAGAQVAELHGNIPPDRFGHLLDALGRWYGRALLAVERNNHGHSTLNTLRNVCRYPGLYRHVRYDHRRGQAPILGWPTDAATKPILVNELATAIAEGHIGIRSAALVDECRTFVMTESGSQEAEQGHRDDRVMAIGIAWQARKRGMPRPNIPRPEGW